MDTKSIAGKTGGGSSIFLLGKQGGDFKIKYVDGKEVCIDRKGLIRMGIIWGDGDFQFSETNRKKWENFWVRCRKNKDICLKHVEDSGKVNNPELFVDLLEAFIIDKD